MHRQRLVILATAMSFSLAMGSLAGSGAALAAGYAEDEEPHAGHMLADAVVVRPLTLVASAIGAALWVVSLPFTIPGGNAAEVGEKAFAGPMRYTFYRPLGYMDEDARPPYAE